MYFVGRRSQVKMVMHRDHAIRRMWLVLAAGPRTLDSRDLGWRFQIEIMNHI